MKSFQWCRVTRSGDKKTTQAPQRRRRRPTSTTNFMSNFPRSIVASGPFRLLDLPPELRQDILSYLLTFNRVIDANKLPRKLLTLLLVCKTLKADAEVAFFTANPIRIMAPSYWLLLGNTHNWLDDPALHVRRMVILSLHKARVPHLCALVRNVFVQPEAYGWTEESWSAAVDESKRTAGPDGFASQLPCLGTISLETIFSWNSEVLERIQKDTECRIQWWPGGKDACPVDVRDGDVPVEEI